MHLGPSKGHCEVLPLLPLFGIWGTTFWVDPKDQLVAVMMMQSAPLQARYYRSLIRNLVSQALID
jgi:CubicO group peptidase (beta-lactamase class C family)